MTRRRTLVNLMEDVDMSEFINEQQRKQSEYMIDIAKIKENILVYIIEYAWDNNLDEKIVLHHVLSDLEEVASDALDMFIEILRSDNKEDIMQQFKDKTK